jgi:hypothetical protein
MSHHVRIVLVILTIVSLLLDMLLVSAYANPSSEQETLTMVQYCRITVHRKEYTAIYTVTLVHMANKVPNMNK